MITDARNSETERMNQAFPGHSPLAGQHFFSGQQAFSFGQGLGHSFISLQQGLSGQAALAGQHFFFGQHFCLGHSAFLTQHFLAQGVCGAGAAGSCAKPVLQQKAAASSVRASFFIAIFFLLVGYWYFCYGLITTLPIYHLS